MAKSNVIWRIDDRLIHGQVIIGWCGQLPIKKIVVCDDEIAKTPWEKELLLMAAPPHLSTSILTQDETKETYLTWEEETDAVMVLIKSINDLKYLVDKGVKINEIHLGGIHYQENRTEILPYVFLSEEEMTIAQDLMNKGMTIECQDLPNATAHSLKKLLDK